MPYLLLKDIWNHWAESGAESGAESSRSIPWLPGLRLFVECRVSGVWSLGRSPKNGENRNNKLHASAGRDGGQGEGLAVRPVGPAPSLFPRSKVAAPPPPAADVRGSGGNHNTSLRPL
ncbi:unnamed protein product [Boreogadus saida]